MGWAGGFIDLTQPVQGEMFSSVQDVDAFCAQSLGDGWRMANFHDGGQWYLWAYGEISEGTRFWVHIGDQADGNCW